MTVANAGARALLLTIRDAGWSQAEHLAEDLMRPFETLPDGVEIDFRRRFEDLVSARTRLRP